MTSTTEVVLEIGTTVRARPWRDGFELDPRKAVIVQPNPDSYPDYVIVWFYTLGEPEVGTTVQIILRSKLTLLDSLDDAPDSVLSRWERAGRRAWGRDLSIYQLGMTAHLERSRRRNGETDQ